MEGPPLGPGGEDITWPDQVAPRGQKASSTREIKPQTSNLIPFSVDELNEKIRTLWSSINTVYLLHMHTHAGWGEGLWKLIVFA